ncbi:MAG TPA: histidine--tRNA ligase [Candidatus Dormibacteraeota bacterium]|nr:histidine--tRNA ligase [Candidatus Dormibacteraeota bacterium]
MPPISRPRGTEDLLPDRLAAMARATEIGMGIAESFGYRELATPIFEATELFVRGVGDTSDVVRREMYTFPDRSGRSLTLRPENTAPVLRAFGESSLRELPPPVRLSYAGPMFRYDRPGRGRYRQFHQFGVEAVGDAGAEMDAEVIAIAWDWLSALGLGGVSLQLNSIGDRVCRPAFRQALLDHFRPHLEQLPELDRERLARNPLRILDSKDPQTAQLMETVPRTLDFLCDECRDAFDRVQLALRAYRIPFQLNPRLVRGLDYYVRTTFEVWHEDLQGAQNALFGGGRYDGLAELLGYPAAPGVGFAAGLERVVMLAPPGPAPRQPQVVVCSAQAAAVPLAIDLAQRLRRDGLTVLCDVGRRSLKGKMRSAERSGAGAVALLGEEELKAERVTLRQLSSGEQLELRPEETSGQLRAWIEAPESEGGSG